MTEKDKYIVGTSGFSFADWVGTFYLPGTKQAGMFGQYVRHFVAVELNFTIYLMTSPATLERMAANSPEGFLFWVKANQQLTHEQDRSACRQFLDALLPMRQANKLAGVLLQFPQSFHRTVANRKFLAAATADMAGTPLAVEFRHRSWQHPSTLDGLRQRNLTLVVPDVPDLADLYAPPPAVTSNIGYLRLHSRNAENWYGGEAKRYDYNYSQAEMRKLLEEWTQLERQVDRVYAMFNNCHRGQAAQNAQAFRRILGQI